MLTKNVSFLVETATSPWKPSKVPGVDYLVLNADPAEKFGTFLLRMAPNTKYPKHRHPGGEEVLLLKGDMMLGDRKMKPGDFVYSPPASIHTASTVAGCMFLTLIPKPVELIVGASMGEFDEEGRATAAALDASSPTADGDAVPLEGNEVPMPAAPTAGIEPSK